MYGLVRNIWLTNPNVQISTRVAAGGALVALRVFCTGDRLCHPIRFGSTVGTGRRWRWVVGLLESSSADQTMAQYSRLSNFTRLLPGESRLLRFPIFGGAPDFTCTPVF
jgi:hypothetical protein